MDEKKQVKFNFVSFKCDCGFVGYLLYDWNKDGWFPDGVAACRRCGQIIYVSSCPKCRYGYASSTKTLLKSDNKILCDICGEKFPIVPSRSTYHFDKVYTYEELPADLIRNNSFSNPIPILLLIGIGIFGITILLLSNNNTFSYIITTLGNYQIFIMVFMVLLCFGIYIKDVIRRN